MLQFSHDQMKFSNDIKSKQLLILEGMGEAFLLKVTARLADLIELQFRGLEISKEIEGIC